MSSIKDFLLLALQLNRYIFVIVIFMQFADRKLRQS